MNLYMKRAYEKAKIGIKNKEGGPFGAIIVKDDKIIAECNNTVLKDTDSTAHAEVNAIRMACKKLNTYDLSGCVLYATSEPCPMCMAAIIWANIKEVYFASDRTVAEKVGFKDKMIYDYFNISDDKIVYKRQIDADECKDIFDIYEDVIY